jgi:hypothetical protein
MATTRKQHRSPFSPGRLRVQTQHCRKSPMTSPPEGWRHVTVTDHHARCLAESGRALSRPSATSARQINEIEALA